MKAILLDCIILLCVASVIFVRAQNADNSGKCVNEFAKPENASSLDWENIPFDQLGSSRYGFTPEGCTQEAVEEYGIYSCAVATVDVGFIPCDGDCQNGKCVDKPITIYKKSICGDGNCLCQLYGGEVTWSDGGDFKCENRTVCSVEMASEGFDCVCEEAEVCGENECLCQRYEEGDIWCEDVAMCKDEGLACKTGPDAEVSGEWCPGEGQCACTGPGQDVNTEWECMTMEQCSDKWELDEEGQGPQCGYW